MAPANKSTAYTGVKDVVDVLGTGKHMEPSLQGTGERVSRFTVPPSHCGLSSPRSLHL
jgi:hypothetical protein